MALLARAFGHFLAAVIAGRANVVAQVDFTGRRFNGQRWIAQKIVSAMHSTLGR